MTVRSSALGMQIAALRTPVERGRLRFFADAVGNTDPLFTELTAAREAGYPDLPVPPTFLFGLRLEMPEPHAWLTDLEVDLRFILHGSQRFDYAQLAFAGDVLDVEAHLVDVFEKRGGALEFLVSRSNVTRAGEPIATLTETLVVRHPELEAAR